MLESRSDRDERLGRVLLETVLGIYWEHQSDAILAINLYGYGQLRDEVRNLGGFVTKSGSEEGSDATRRSAVYSRT